MGPCRSGVQDTTNWFQGMVSGRKGAFIWGVNSLPFDSKICTHGDHFGPWLKFISQTIIRNGAHQKCNRQERSLWLCKLSRNHARYIVYCPFTNYVVFFESKFAHLFHKKSFAAVKLNVSLSLDMIWSNGLRNWYGKPSLLIHVLL